MTGSVTVRPAARHGLIAHRNVPPLLALTGVSRNFGGRLALARPQ
ncbi:MAG TPA: hypothetical protein VMV07_17570 [Streptosporangiaceae bacterium]|nr:hypothetical protein [Streptosporangiaceae bacterium]